MRNIPFFDTPYGVASLVLKEIPYSAQAYITVQSALDLDKLLEENTITKEVYDKICWDNAAKNLGLPSAAEMEKKKGGNRV